MENDFIGLPCSSVTLTFTLGAVEAMKLIGSLAIRSYILFKLEAGNFFPSFEIDQDGFRGFALLYPSTTECIVLLSSSTLIINPGNPNSFHGPSETGISKVYQAI